MTLPIGILLLKKRLMVYQDKMRQKIKIEPAKKYNKQRHIRPTEANKEMQTN
jgi:hypothetical protein